MLRIGITVAMVVNRMMLKVADVLRRKGSEVLCLKPTAPVRRALGLMTELHVGALVIRSASLPLGVFSERDYVRSSAKLGPSVLEEAVQTVMTVESPWVCSSDTLETCLNLMTSHTVRHLVVVDSLKMSGLVSMGDIVGELLADQGAELQRLQEYIARPC